MSKPSPVERVTRWVRRVFFWLPSSTQDGEQPPEAHHHDHHLVIAVTAPERIPRLRQLRYALRIFSTNERRIVYAATLVFLLALGTAGFIFSRDRIVTVPTVGGSVTEALVGEPKYINPLDAPTNDVDSDLSELIYSGLFRMKDLTPVPDLAQEYSWSDDRKTLIVKLRQDARFHDGVPLTSEDVRFTYDSLEDPARKSPLAPNFHGVTINVDDDATVRFTLDKPDASFLSKLTVGILPAHLWQDVPPENARLSDFNLKPIGSGPYRVKSFLRDTVGNIQSYMLERNSDFYGVQPYLANIVFQFYPDSQSALDAFRSNLVGSVPFVSTADAKNIGQSARAHDVSLQLPEESIAFFNLKDQTLNNKDVRQALSLAINRDDITGAFGSGTTAVSGPYPFVTTSSTPQDLNQARALLTNAGWILPDGGNIRIWSPPKKAPTTSSSKKKTTTDTTSAATATPAAASTTQLELTIDVANEPDLLAIAEILKRQWSLIGAEVTIDPLPTDELMRKATRDRNAQIVLLNIFLGPDQDVFPFWWSGQAVDRGFNISSLTDRAVDNALQATRNAMTAKDLETARQQVASAIQDIYPAAFLVRPIHHYLVSSSIQGVADALTISHPSDRLLDVLDWYTKTGWRWK